MVRSHSIPRIPHPDGASARESLPAILRGALAIALLVCAVFPPAARAQVTPGENLELGGVPPIPKEVVERTNQYQNIRSAGFADWDRSGAGVYISTRFGNTSQIHLVETPGGARRQLTFFDEPVGSARSDPRPGRSGFLFTKDVGGGEFYQIFHFDRRTGRHRMLTDGKSRNGGGAWTKSGALISYSSNLRNKKDTDVWIMDPERPESARRLTEREGSWYPGEWSLDERRLFITRYVSANESHPYLYDLTDGSMRHLGADSTARVAYGNLRFSPDGRRVYYTSDEGGEFQWLYVLDLATGARRTLTPGLQWDVEDVALALDGRHLAYTVNEEGMSRLRVLTLPGMKEVPVRNLPMGLIGGLEFDPAGTRIALTINASTSPGDVYTLELRSGRLTRWTNSEIGGLDPASFIEPTIIRYPTFDTVNGARRTIPALVYTPAGGAPRKPVIIDIHGGPEGQTRPWFSSTYQYWVKELGCVVIAPNVRGSTGYGKTYLALDNGMNREHSVRDIGALLDWIATQPHLDASRVAVHGGSYGGYMVLASMATYPDRIRCGVDVVGISNFVTFLQNTESYRRDLRRVEYGDERDPEMRAFLEKISPLTNAGSIRSPLFVAQGENDPRVPASEARQIVDAVKKHGVPVWTFFAKDEGHGFRKKPNRDYFMWSTIMFWNAFLLD